MASLASFAHLGQVLGGGRLAVGAALAHHVDPQRRVRQIRRDVDVPLARIEGVHVLREGLPVPRQAVGHHHTGDVFDAGHHVDQHVVVFLAARREADAAVAHHHGGHPVRRRRRQSLRPDGLAVVVGVQVDEAGRDQQPGRVDLPRRAGAVDVADRGDHAVLDGDVADERLTAQPVDDGAVADDQVVGHLNNLRPCRDDARIFVIEIIRATALMPPYSRIPRRQQSRSRLPRVGSMSMSDSYPRVVARRVHSADRARRRDHRRADRRAGQLPPVAQSPTASPG